MIFLPVYIRDYGAGTRHSEESPAPASARGISGMIGTLMIIAPEK
jgi:hypothetical protein